MPSILDQIRQAEEAAAKQPRTYKITPEHLARMHEAITPEVRERAHRTMVERSDANWRSKPLALSVRRSNTKGVDKIANGSLSIPAGMVRALDQAGLRVEYYTLDFQPDGTIVATPVREESADG